MKYKHTFITLPALTFSAFASAQDLNEAYNLSNLTVQGTARSMGFGNALGSIGGDFSSASVNPAGLGIYRSSEFTFTPSLRINSSSSQYLGTLTPDNNVRFTVNNFGLVFTNAPKGKRYEKRKWKAVSFALGVNRVADFNRNYAYGGVNSANSATLAFEADANQYPDDVESTSALSVPGYIGYQAYLLYGTKQNGYQTVVPFSGGVRQDKTVQERGRINEFAISLGGNYQEQLMVGATLGIPTVRYSVTSGYSEFLDPGNNNPNPDTFMSFRYNQQLDVKGTGVNLKLGAIFKANDKFRVGASFHTPTIYALSETYTPYLSADVHNMIIELSKTNGAMPTDQFTYSFISPWRGILSGSYIMKGVGFITFDYEYIGYGSMAYSYPTGDGFGTSYAQAEYDMNQAIKSTFQNTSNFRIGAEGLITKFFMARAGFGYYGNPYKATNSNGQRMDISGGIGFRDNNFFADIALVHSIYQTQTVPYNINYDFVITSSPKPIPVATTDFAINNVAFTIGVKF
jgi:hypothetical protein